MTKDHSTKKIKLTQHYFFFLVYFEKNVFVTFFLFTTLKYMFIFTYLILKIRKLLSLVFNLPLLLTVVIFRCVFENIELSIFK